MTQETKPRTRRWRPRNVVVFGGTLAVLAALFATDPDQGISTGFLVMGAAIVFLVAALAHVVRKALFDYIDMGDLHDQARKDPIGAGLVFLGVCIVLGVLLMVAAGAAKAQPLDPHPRAVALAPTLKAETSRHWPELPWREYVPALISHESCITYTHSRCWSPTSELRSQREQGLGLGQLTRTWRPDGSLRFDSLAEMRDRHPALRELDWRTLRERPDLQIRALVLMSRDNWQALRMVEDPWQRLAMVDAAYNGGLGGVQRERRACQVAAGCDPQKWWGHVERHCLKSRALLYGQRSACDINRQHVADVLNVRMPRYREMMA